MLSLLRFGTVAIVLVSVSACVDEAHNGPTFDLAKIAQIERGKTTMVEVIALFGPPPSLVTQYDGRKLANYTASDTTSMMVPKSIAYGRAGKPTPGIDDPIVLPAMAAITGDGVSVGLYARDVQVLEIRYSASDTVEDYRLDDCDRHSCHPVATAAAPQP